MATKTTTTTKPKAKAKDKTPVKRHRRTRKDGAPFDKSKDKPGKVGAKVIKIDLGEFEKLAGLQCTYADAAAWFSVTIDTIKRRLKEPEFREAWDRGAGKGRVSLRRKQNRLADTNAAMAIFLGKNYLSQSDKHINEHVGLDGRPIMVRWADEDPNSEEDDE